jgi:hypothetical protein
VSCEAASVSAWRSFDSLVAALRQLQGMPLTLHQVRVRVVRL